MTLVTLAEALRVGEVTWRRNSKAFPNRRSKATCAVLSLEQKTVKALPRTISPQPTGFGLDLPATHSISVAGRPTTGSPTRKGRARRAAAASTFPSQGTDSNPVLAQLAPCLRICVGRFP
jgi:hypothetical protein